ncbi:Eukaryotic translation initiation factor 2D [Mizuhopecten yessoensis]|uniref:Eukaryotic translation initiation factor 2D n=2 Tax=Mizuhopecten yessoensis TaxID=6573 RepID=A0A210Q7S1_MIZYE|nr:Eukaryotic translation initiation factor 2D [Mizuhopecten yessoensis]
MTVTKIYTHSGDTAVFYSLNKNPAFLEFGRQLYPTVYTLWKFPCMMFTFTTWSPLLKKFLGGADLMLPGVIVQGEITPATFKHINKGDTCAVKLNGNLAPVAVGKTALSGSDMFDSGMRGKGVHFIHMLGDELWAYGDQSQPPLIPDAAAVKDIDSFAEEGGGAGNDCAAGDGTDREMSNHVRSLCVEDDVNRSSLTNNQVGNHGDNIKGATGGNHGDNAESAKAGDPDVSASVGSGTDEVDALLDRCFKCAIKASVKDSDLPLLTSAFYRQHMLPYCPTGKSLDIKKSSYKKLSVFLRQKMKEGYIRVREDYTRDAEVIVSICDNHLGLEDINASDLERSFGVAGATAAESFQTPIITEMFSIPSALVHLVKPYGHSKGSALTGQEMRTLITDYVRDNNLQDENNKRQIQLDPHLADIVLNKGEGNTLYMNWEDVFSKVLSKAQPAFSVTYPGKPAVISKGKLEPIRITVEQRASNKKATLIDNLETFGIDATDLAHRVQVGVACSTSVIPHPQKGKGMQVLIQGNQVRFVADLLLEKFKVPRKYVTGLEKMPKSKKKK